MITIDFIFLSIFWVGIVFNLVHWFWIIITIVRAFIVEIMEGSISFLTSLF